jgi:hypothetical protein
VANWQLLVLALGTLLVLVSGITAIVIETGRDMTCSTGYSRDFCDEGGGELETWFATVTAQDLSSAGAWLAALIVPFVVGLIVRRWEWVLFPPVAVVVCIFLGQMIGERYMEHRYPDTNWPGTWLWLGLLIVMVLGIGISGVAATVGVLAGKAVGIGAREVRRRREDTRQQSPQLESASNS